MRLVLILSALLFPPALIQAEDDYPVSEDSKLHEGVAKGEMLKGSYTAAAQSVFPGTEREYQLYIPAGLDKSKPTPFMVFQDGVIYNAPVVFDNLIAKKEIPAMIGVFIKPGVVPAANPEALPRFNRSYEYDSVTDTYSRFLIDEFFPAIMKKHGITLSTDPNDAGISGNSSGGICAFMVAWHRSDRFRRVFTGVGTYVGIHGADQLPVLVRKMEPKPIKVYLQSGENDNNLYCGDWWMANQMMERSLTWAGYDVAHTWGTGGHNGKQATAIFPDVMRWLWMGYPEQKIKANPEGKSKWLGYQVLKEGNEWEDMNGLDAGQKIDTSKSGQIKLLTEEPIGKPIAWIKVKVIAADGHLTELDIPVPEPVFAVTWGLKKTLVLAYRKDEKDHIASWSLEDGKLNEIAEIPWKTLDADKWEIRDIVVSHKGCVYVWGKDGEIVVVTKDGKLQRVAGYYAYDGRLTLSPDQSQLYVSSIRSPSRGGYIESFTIQSDGTISLGQSFCRVDSFDGQKGALGMCVDNEGRLYICTAMGLQVCDQAGRVNFIIPIPQVDFILPGISTPLDVWFGGKDQEELFISSSEGVFKRQTKVHGVVSGQQPPIKPAPPKL